MEIRMAVLGEQHPDYKNSLGNLAGLYYSMSNYLRAESLYVQAMEIEKAVLGEQHPDFATSLNNLAALYKAMGDYPRAEPLHVQAIKIQKAVLGEQHPNYANSLNNLAGLYESMGDYARAEPLFREAVEITLGNLELTADVQSRRQQMRMGEFLRHRLDSYLSLATNESKFQRDAYAALLRWKGSVWQRQVRQQSLMDQPSLQPRVEALQSVSSKLSTLIFRVPDPKQQAAWRRQLDELTDQREKLERDLSLASVAFRQASTPVTPEQLRACLPEGTVLVDFLEYEHITPANLEQQTETSWERRLLVHVVNADEEVRAIDLGDVESLNALVQTWRRDLGQSPAAIDAARELRKRIWQPLEAHLGGITTVYVSPDGLLGQFPVAALPGKRPGSYLIEDLAIVMLPVPQGLPAMTSSPSLDSPSLDSGNDRFCLVGGVDYEQAIAPTTPSTPTGSMMLAVRGGEWQAFSPLPGTVTEINEIESLITANRPAIQTTILRGGSASESVFADVASGHRFLHVATHGFFAPETVQNAMTASAPDRMMAISETRAPQLTGQHPDLLSGLVFAGANRQPDSAIEKDASDDGILTAAEVQSLDLRGVDLAVLSACETGLGRTAGGEGIIGLQRAFQLAGARTTITSLWKVDDAATQALMVEFYRNLFERKLSKLESLRQAQLWMLNNPDVIEGRDLTQRGGPITIKTDVNTKTVADRNDRSLPAHWAAFQLSGDPR
jgi:CHAT domain-containing protein